MASLRKRLCCVFLTRHQRLYRQPGVGKPPVKKPHLAGVTLGSAGARLAEKAFPHMGHHIIALLCGFSGVYYIVVLLGSLLTHPVTPCPTLTAVAPGGRRSFSQTKKPMGMHRLDPSLQPRPPPGHHGMCCPTFPQHGDRLRVPGGRTCLSCHFHLALRGHRAALYTSLILKYHLLHPESN